MEIHKEGLPSLADRRGIWKMLFGNMCLFATK